MVVGRTVLHFINNEDQEALDYKTQRRTNAINSYKEINTWSLYPSVMTFKISLIYV